MGRAERGGSVTDIDTMSIDELRIAVAREVMGWSEVSSRRSADGTLTGIITTVDGRQIVDDIPDYPRDIAEAWAVVDVMTFSDKRISHAMMRQFRNWWGDVYLCDYSAQYAAELICRAALFVVRGHR